MFLQTIFRARIDWVIAAGRVLLAVFGLAAILLDPSQPAKFAEITYVLIAGYAFFALIVLGLVLVRPYPSERVALFTHVADLSAFTAVMYLTEGSTSPFFLFFTFALLSATLRWGWRGVLWTDAASLASLAILGWWALDVVEDTDFELNSYVIRSVYLVVAGLMLAYLAAHEAQIRSALARLSAPLPPLREDLNWPIREALGFAAEVLNAKRLLFAWSEKDEPWQQLAEWNDGELLQRSELPDRFHPLVEPGLAEASFFCPYIANNSSVLIHEGGSRFSRWWGAPIHPALCREQGISCVVSVPIAFEGLSARLFLLDRVAYSADNVQLAELAAARIRSLFEQHRLLRRLSRVAADEERLRIARDIHDGALQFLAGTGLRLQSVVSLIATDPEGAAKSITEFQRTLVTEQVHLRALVNGLRDSESEPPPYLLDIKQTLSPLIEHLRQQWGIRIDCRVVSADALLDNDTTHEVARILGEAVANARRHGGAESVEVTVRVQGDCVDIVIADDGGGCQFRGRYDLSTLQSRRLGPRSVCERVAALGGRLTLESDPSGTRIEISVPMLRDLGAPPQQAQLTEVSQCLSASHSPMTTRSFSTA